MKIKGLVALTLVLAIEQTSLADSNSRPNTNNFRANLSNANSTPDSFEERVALGNKQRLSGNFSGAIAAYRSALSLRNDPNLHIQLGDTYRVQGANDKAIEEYESALKGSKTLAAEFKLGQAYQATKNLPEAINHYLQAVSEEKDNGDAMAALILAWKEVVKTNPAAPENHIGLGQSEQYSGNFSTAGKEYRMALDLSPNQSNIVAQTLLRALPELKSRPTHGRDIYPPCMPWAVPKTTRTENSSLTPKNADEPASQYISAMEARIYDNWELGGLPNNKTLTVSFTIGAGGKFKDVRLRKTSGVPQADFCAQQAVVESSGFRADVPPQITQMSSVEINLRPDRNVVKHDCCSELFKLSSEAEKKGVVWHLIPIDALHCVKHLSPQLVHSTTNLRLIRHSYIDSTELAQAQNEWLHFLRDRSNLSVGDVLHQAKVIDREYGFMFEKWGSEASNPHSPG